MAEHVKNPRTSRDTRVRKRREIVLNVPSHSVRRQSDHRLTLTLASKRLGGISPKILEILAQKHNIPLDQSADLILVSVRSLRQLERLPEVRAIQEMTKLSYLGHEMTEEGLRILSETRPGPLPWQQNR